MKRNNNILLSSVCIGFWVLFYGFIVIVPHVFSTIDKIVHTRIGFEMMGWVLVSVCFVIIYLIAKKI